MGQQLKKKKTIPGNKHFLIIFTEGKNGRNYEICINKLKLNINKTHIHIELWDRSDIMGLQF